MRTEVGFDSNVGRVREHNEDACDAIHFSGGDVLIVCDGMGGHAAGDVAAAIARSTISAGIVENAFDDPRELLFRAIEAAHERVLAAARGSGAHSGMGTTAVVALIRKGALYLGHVGDSRAYLVRGSQVSQLTRDQTRVQEMVDGGFITEEAAKSHPDAGVLAQAVGQPRGLIPYVTPDEGGIGLQIGDRLVLCSDGVYDSMAPDDFRQLTADRSATEGAQVLVHTAVERDGQDNATAVVAIIHAEQAQRPVPTTMADALAMPPGRTHRTVPDSLQSSAASSRGGGVRTALVAGLVVALVVALVVGLPVAFVLGRYTRGLDAPPSPVPTHPGPPVDGGPGPEPSGSKQSPRQPRDAGTK